MNHTLREEFAYHLPQYIPENPNPELHKQQLESIGINTSATSQYREQFGTRIGELVEASLSHLRIISREEVDLVQSTGIGEVLNVISAERTNEDPIVFCFEPGRSGILDLLNAYKTINSPAFSKLKDRVKFSIFDEKGDYPQISNNSHCILLGDITYTGGHLNTMNYALASNNFVNAARKYIVYAGASNQALQQAVGIPRENVWLGYKVRNILDLIKPSGFTEEEITTVFNNTQFVPDLVTQRYPDSLTDILELASGESVFGQFNRDKVLPQINAKLTKGLSPIDLDDLQLRLSRGDQDIHILTTAVANFIAQGSKL